MRTTLDLDGPLLRELKKIQKTEGKSLGRVASDLIAQALGARRDAPRTPREVTWTTRPMDARVDLSDKEAVRTAMEGANTGVVSRRRAR
jgi:hypothetical protein